MRFFSPVVFLPQIGLNEELRESDLKGGKITDLPFSVNAMLCVKREEFLQGIQRKRLHVALALILEGSRKKTKQGRELRKEGTKGSRKNFTQGLDELKKQQEELTKDHRGQ